VTSVFELMEPLRAAHRHEDPESENVFFTFRVLPQGPSAS